MELLQQLKRYAVAACMVISSVINAKGAEPEPAILATSFYRAINMNGAALTIDGNSWTASSGAANFSFTGNTFENQSVTLSPSTDTNRATMIRSSVWGSNVTAAISAVPNGYYKIYVYVWEDNWPETFSISLEGTTAVSNYNSGEEGSWAKLGPFIRNITDGTINLSTSGGAANISGIEVWSISAPPIVANPIPDHTAIVGEAFNYTVAANAFTDPDAGTTLSLSATLSNGNPLPSWLAFNSTTRKFSGTPASGDIASINIRVTATDGDTDVSDDFTLTVANGFYRAINLNGAALTIDGNAWEASSGAPNFSMTGISFSEPSVTLIPATDANRATMIRSSIYADATVNITAVPAGTYDIYVYVWEDNWPTNYSLSIEGSAVLSNVLTGSAGEWSRLGPFRRTIADGAINVAGTNELNISGVDVRRASTGETPLDVTVSPATVRLTAGQATRLNSLVIPNTGSNQGVTWSSSNTNVVTVDATGLVRAVATGTATVTATSTHGSYSGSSAFTVLNAGANTIANPEFDQGLDHWNIVDLAGTPANSATVVQNAGLSGANALYIDINNTNSDVWRYMARTVLPFRLEVGRTYNISFMAKAQAPRDLTVTLDGQSTQVNYSYNTVAVTTSPQTFNVSYTCNSSEVDAEAAFTLSFFTAIGALNDVWIDKVHLDDVTGITPVSAVTLAPATLTLSMGGTAQLTPTIAPSNATNQNVTWTSSNPAVATVSATGLVTAVADGSATITVQTENGGRQATTAVTVSTVAVTGLTLSPTHVNIPAGNTVRLYQTIQPSNATNQGVTWSSANTAIATVDANGVVSAVAPGFTTVTGTSISGSFTASASIHVLPAAADFIVNGEFNAGTSSWRLDDYTSPAGANISVVTDAAMSGANALRIDVQNAANDDWTLQLVQDMDRKIELGKTYRISFLAKAQTNRAMRLSIFGSNIYNYVYETFNLTTGVQRYTLDYTCNQSEVLSETNFSFKLYLAMGTISDVWLDDVTMVDITPPVAVTGVTLVPATASLQAGETLQLTPTISPANATNTNVSWSSSNAAVASVNATGLVSAAGPGSAVITVTTADGNHTSTSEVTVTAGTFTSLEQVLQHFTFQYKYDGRKRMTHKKVPGADWVYMVYDDRDRLVMTQDGNQRSRTPREWTFTKYDALNRPVLTGIYTEDEATPLDQNAMQDEVNAFYVAAESNADEWFENAGSVVHGYTNNSFPDVPAEAAYLTVTWYDDYEFKTGITTNAQRFDYDNDQLIASGAEPGQPENNFNRVKGLVTGTKVKNLETGEWYYNVNYYDDRYRVIQSIADNAKGGTNTMTSVYDFTGKVLRTRTDHNIASGPAVATERRMSYDHAGRLLQTDHKTGSDPFVTLAKNEYNELGQLTKKGLHSTDNGSYFKQQVDYRYNIRGWLTRINDSELSGSDGGPADYFGMRLGYNDGLGINNAAPQFNGNISAIKYSANLGLGINDAQLEILEPTERGYAFRYDALNRLQHADHHTHTVQWAASASYDENGISYDMNGNILTLSRSGKLDPNMDVLGYQYMGNRLLSVTDTGDDEEGFKDGNTTGTDYLYDHNGNMVTDLNKGISTITYNYLNLPARVEKNTGEYVRYYYDATGAKLSQEVYNASDELQKKSDYLGEYFYENDTLRFLNHEEGRVVLNEQAPEYQYMLKDHLGNVRVTFTGKNTADTSTATMETSTQTEEEENFNNYNSTVNDLLDHTDAGTTYDRVLILNGGYNGQVGLAKSFAVMPGDKVSAKVYAKYTGSPGQASALGSFAAALTSAFGLTPTGIIDGPTAYSALNDIGGILATGDHPGDEDGDPKAFLNILVFDKNYNLVDFGFDQLGEEYEQTGATKTAHDELTVETTIRQAGYVYVFLSNEEAYELQVGFDDYEVKHEQSGVVQMEEYYPFGLTFNSYQRENSVPNRYTYNGKEDQDELGLGWLDYGTRMLDPTIGRWNSIDPYSDVYEELTPYNYALNNPTSVIDADGQLVVYVNGFRVGAYAKYLEDVHRRSTSYGVPYQEALEPWAHNERFYKNDVYNYWSQFDLNFWNGTEDRLFVDGMFYPKSKGGGRFDRGKAEGKLLAEKIKSGEITLEDGETIKLIGHSHGGAHAMGMAQGLLDAGIDCDLINVFLFAPHQPNQIPKVDVKVYQFSREGDKVASKGKLGSTFTAIDGANFTKMPDGNDDQLGNHGIQTYTTEEVRQQNPELYQWLVGQGIINQDGSLKNN